MAYVSGTATSLAGLLSSIQSACTSNGWTLSGSVLHKGTCYAEISISGSVIQLISGTGIDGSNNLTGKSTSPTAYMCGPLYFASTVEFTWPVAYDVFIGTNPDEVYVHVMFATNCHEQIGWGLSAMPGLLGSGNWYAGGNNHGGTYGYSGSNYGSPGTEIIINGSGQAVALFASDRLVSCGIDHALDGASWSGGYGARDIGSTFGRQPNQYNGESILMPVRCYASRPSGFISPVLECAHLRYVNNANLSDGQIITLGTDRWMVYPYARRGSVDLQYGHGGQWGAHAFRYDGP